MTRPLRDGVQLFALPDAYDQHMGRYSRELCAPFIAVAGVSAGMSVLDVGCGTGVLTAALAQQIGPEHVVGADPSEAFVATCRSRAPGAEIVIAEAESLPFPDARFDAVLAQLVVNFMDDARTAVGEMRRVARPGGAVVGCVWDYASGMTMLRSFWDAAIDLGLPRAREQDQGRTMPFCSPTELADLWLETGLGDVETGELVATVEYASFEDLWAPFALGISPAGVYVTSLEPAAAPALREELFQRLGRPDAAFRLSAQAFWVRGRR